MLDDEAFVLSVNVSSVKTAYHRGKPLSTGIFKTPVEGRVPLSSTNLRGDDQADRRVHGGRERAVYAYADEDYRWWQERLGITLRAGKFGENLTLRGVDVSGALVGERWQVGTAVLQVASPRVPCFKLGIAMDDPRFVRRFAEALRPGAYLGVVQEGAVAGGDRVEVIWRPDHGLSLSEMMRIYLYDRTRLSEMLVPELPSGWLEWVESELSAEQPSS